MNVVIGDILTVNCDVIDISGCIIFRCNQKVEVDEVLKKEPFWGKMSGVYYPEEITGIKLVNTYGIWSLKTFKETSNNTKITREVIIEKFIFKSMLIDG